MMWLRLDDGMPTSPAALTVTHDAFRLFVVALSYCAARQIPDGILAEGVVSYLSSLHGVSPTVSKALVAADLWCKEGMGYRIVGFASMLPAPHGPSA